MKVVSVMMLCNINKSVVTRTPSTNIIITPVTHREANLTFHHCDCSMQCFFLGIFVYSQNSNQPKENVEIMVTIPRKNLPNIATNQIWQAHIFF